jgi:hypothetical protein
MPTHLPGTDVRWILVDVVPRVLPDIEMHHPTTPDIHILRGELAPRTHEAFEEFRRGGRAIACGQDDQRLTRSCDCFCGVIE